MNIKILKKYFRIYGMLLRLNWARLFAYRGNLINSSMAHSVWAINNILAMLLLTSKTSHIFGWSRNELLILAGVYNVVSSIFYFFFARNFSELPGTVHFGRLDALLIKPIDSQFLATCSFVNYTHGIRFILGVVFILYILGQMHLVLTPLIIINFILMIIISLTILYSVWFLIMTLTLWFTNLSNLVDLLFEIMNVTKYPQEIYRGANLFLFYALFPLTLVVIMPAKALIQKLLFGEIFIPLLFAGGLFFLSRKFWQFALRSYTSASG